MKKEKSIKNFIDVLEIVYSLFLAVGLSNLLFNFVFSATYLSLLFISVLIITRFFFAPSKNIEGLLIAINDKGEDYKYRNHQFSAIMWFDVPILFFHAVIFSIMCSFVSKQTDIVYSAFFYGFILLLVLNSFWLYFIEYRKGKQKKTDDSSLVFWASSNLIFAFIMSLILCNTAYFNVTILNTKIIYIILFIFGSANCLLDLSTQYKTYLFHEKREHIFYIS